MHTKQINIWNNANNSIANLKAAEPTATGIAAATARTTATATAIAQ